MYIYKYEKKLLIYYKYEYYKIKFARIFKYIINLSNKNNENIKIILEYFLTIYL